ncbi:hypothetical protein ACGFNX_30425 [Streptomyces sp. NPDC048723]|uniref:hypothetical protein n=1 Tax=unclassified Streptomyces TaxID=2593676 RepID=UPI000A9A7457
MANAFQERKLRGMFAAFDADGDGYLREEDFTALVGRWGRLPGVEPGTVLRARVEALLMGWWAALLEAGDANGDGAVDMGELLALVDRLPTMVPSRRRPRSWSRARWVPFRISTAGPGRR